MWLFLFHVRFHLSNPLIITQLFFHHPLLLHHLLCLMSLWTMHILLHFVALVSLCLLHPPQLLPVETRNQDSPLLINFLFWFLKAKLRWWVWIQGVISLLMRKWRAVWWRRRSILKKLIFFIIFYIFNFFTNFDT